MNQPISPLLPPLCLRRRTFSHGSIDLDSFSSACKLRRLHPPIARCRPSSLTPPPPPPLFCSAKLPAVFFSPLLPANSARDLQINIHSLPSRCFHRCRYSYRPPFSCDHLLPSPIRHVTPLFLPLILAQLPIPLQARKEEARPSLPTPS